MDLSAEAICRMNGQDLDEKEKAEAEAKRNHNFLQIEKSQLKEMRRLVGKDPNAFKLLTILAERMNRQNAICCSQKTLMKITGLGRTSVHNAVAVLKDEHWLQVVKIGNANAYVINSRVFWQSTGDLKYSVFNASIIASEEEQDPKELENWKGVKLKQFPVLERNESATIINTKLPPPDQDEMDI